MPATEDLRTLLAAERTLLAWQRTVVALMGFGFVLERFSLVLERSAGAPMHAGHRLLGVSLGVLLMLAAAGAAVLSAWQFRGHVRAFAAGAAPPGWRAQVGVWLNLALATIAGVLALYFVVALRAGQM